MRRPLVPPVRRRREDAPPTGEVARVRALYLESLRGRVASGSYFTEARVRTALERLHRALRDDSRPA